MCYGSGQHNDYSSDRASFMKKLTFLLLLIVIIVITVYSSISINIVFSRKLYYNYVELL